MSRKGKDVGWSAAELDVVREFYPKEPVRAVAARLPGRTRDAVIHAARSLGIKGPRSWTAADDAALRAEWGKVRTWDLAKRIGRSPSALKQRAVKLGLDSDRYYTAADLALVRELYPTHTAAQIAERVHGTARAALSIYRIAERIGLRKAPHWTDEERDRVRVACAAGGTDRDIAARLNLTREQVTHVRNRLGIPRDAAAVRAAARRAVANQGRTLGVSNGGQLRAYGYRRFARANGWPEDLPPRAVQVLNVLAEHGPKTKRELAEAIGMPTTQIGGNGYPTFLKASARSSTMKGHGSYTALLVARGFVARHRRSAGPGSGARGGKLPDLYLLTPAAIAWREQHGTGERGGDRERGGEEAGVQPADAGRGAGEDAGGAGHGGVGRSAPGGGAQCDHARGGDRDHGEAGRDGEGRRPGGDEVRPRLPDRGVPAGAPRVRRPG